MSWYSHLRIVEWKWGHHMSWYIYLIDSADYWWLLFYTIIMRKVTISKEKYAKRFLKMNFLLLLFKHQSNLHHQHYECVLPHLFNSLCCLILEKKAYFKTKIELKWELYKDAFQWWLGAALLFSPCSLYHWLYCWLSACLCIHFTETKSSGFTVFWKASGVRHVRLVSRQDGGWRLLPVQWLHWVDPGPWGAFLRSKPHDKSASWDQNPLRVKALICLVF